MLIVGLGNPGPEYARNRHNVGFRVLDVFAQAHQITFRRILHQALIAEGRLAGQRVILAKPQTFMNLSGRSVRPLVSYYRIPLDRILVVYDDMDLPLGTIRLRPRGSPGGHNGMKSIVHALGTTEFPRLRIGIGRPPGHMNPADYVLQDFRPDEEEILEGVLHRALQAIRTFIEEGLEAAMNRFNAQPVMHPIGKTGE
ncbi:MAG: aminoacyl-tRNA hydrolase [Anaerolineae bacterium]|nr:aminoacyl-tRNA hydrolase [Anaerolineae bacterium]